MKLTSIATLLSAALAATLGTHAQAATGFSLSNYAVSAVYALDSLNGTSGGISGLEGSAITYARDRGTLFYVGDEGTGVVEISLTGQTLGYMNFNWAGTGSTKHDTEGLAYVGNGQLVVTEERLQDAYKFSYVASGTANLSSSFSSISNTSVGNSGIEGISYDPRNGSFVTVKQENPQNVWSGMLTFSPATGGLPATLTKDGVSPTGGGSSTMSALFDPNALLGVSTLSDVQTLSPISALAGTSAADNLLILSLGSRVLLEVDRSGTIKSRFDLSNVLAHNGIEGVTVDEKGTIYLIAEQIQDGSNLPGDLNPKSQLIVLTAAVPEPETYAMMGLGLAVIGAMARRRRTRQA